MKLIQLLIERKIIKKNENAYSSFDVIGDICVLQIPDNLLNRKKKIGKLILETQTHVKGVYRKKEGMKGKHRVWSLEWLAGRKGTTTIHLENGCRYALDLKTCFFNPRYSFERQRIYDLAKKKEFILIPFSGIGAFSIPLAKKGCRITSIELNKEACKYAEKNNELNKVQVEIIQGDAKKLLKSEWKADRIIACTPTNVREFFPELITALDLRKGGMIHIYHIESDESQKEFKKFLKEQCKQTKTKCKILNERIARPYAAGVNTIVSDVFFKK